MSENFRPLTEEEQRQYLIDSDKPSQSPSIQSFDIAGSERLKDPFTVSQKQTAGYAARMQRAVEQMERLEDSGFDPVNFKDSVLVEYAPFIPDLAENFLKSSKYQQYQRAMTDFIMAQLRDESGAAISAGEFPLAFRIYIPQPGDGPEVIQAKREARRSALSAMKAGAGKAFDRAYSEAQGVTEGQTPSSEKALMILLERAKKDPELAEKLRQRGLLPQ